MKVQKVKTIKRDDVREYLSECKPFRNGTAYAIYDNDNTYIVMSYVTVIARIDPNTRKVLEFDGKHYSSTTSFIQNAVRDVFDTSADALPYINLRNGTLKRFEH